MSQTSERETRPGLELAGQPPLPPTGHRRQRPPGGDLSRGEESAYAKGDREFHIKFGYGAVVAVEGHKLTVAFEQAGEKKVLDSFVERG